MDTQYRTSELYWAVGFLEGEGSFYCSEVKSLLRIMAPQKEREPLARLQQLLGGSLRTAIRRYKGQPHEMFEWDASGSRAAGIMMTVYVEMSQRRRTQIRLALSRWKAHRAHHRHWTTCKRGHPLTVDNVYAGSDGARRCRTCVRAWARRKDSAKRLQVGSVPRAKLTEVQVQLIRLRFATGTPQAVLCREFGIGPAAMHHLVHRITWKHVK